jgi:hypothetical protein
VGAQSVARTFSSRRHLHLHSTCFAGDVRCKRDTLLVPFICIARPSNILFGPSSPPLHPFFLARPRPLNLPSAARLVSRARFHHIY